jgi:hypothetical protein
MESLGGWWASSWSQRGRSYLNFLITNKVVLAQKFWQEGWPEEWKKLDEQAMQILQA